MENNVPEYATVIRGSLVIVNKVGGGTVGKEYYGDWAVCVIDEGVRLLDNDIIGSPTLKGHRQMAYEAYNFAMEARGA